MLVALFTEPISALWVVLLFIGLQQIEGHIVAPQLFGHTLRINPILVIFALLLGLEVDGIIGALVALPILSVLRETAVYLSRHVTFESWDRWRKRELRGERPRCASSALGKRYGELRRAARRQLRAGARASSSRSSGPNGAGKTTLLSIVAGVQRPSAGQRQRGHRERGRLGARSSRRCTRS